MILDNWYVLHRAITYTSGGAIGGAISGSDSFTWYSANLSIINANIFATFNNTKTLKNTSNSSSATVAIMTYGGSNYAYPSANHWPFSAIVFGSGITLPAATDYNLNSPFTSSQISCLSGTETVTYNATSVVYRMTRDIKNISTENIIIAELGALKNDGRLSSHNVTGSGILITRDLLATPITLQPQQTAQIIYTITFE